MEAITDLTEIDYTKLIIWLFIILFALQKIIDIFSYLKKKFRIKTGSDEDKETIENRIKKLEKHDSWQYNEISKISQGIDEIKKYLEENERTNNERIITQYGAELYNLHEKFMEQKYVTRAGLETFQSLADIYLSCGGNHLIKQKIIPEVQSLEIRGGAYGTDD